MLVTHEDEDALDDLFEKILAKLRKTAFLTDDLTVQREGNQQVALCIAIFQHLDFYQILNRISLQKYLGVCKLPKDGSKHRRLDIIVVPPQERACAMMYFTGSAHFNRSMRLFATKMGMSLSEHALVENVVRRRREKLNEGSAVATPTEESIFERLGLPYRAPHERNH